jgi:UDP-glucuronate 4-epimerase
MKILVTGGAGFIGSHLIERLLGQGREVVCLDRFDPYYDVAVKRRNVQGFAGKPGFRLVEGDIRDRDLVDGLLGERPNVVIHLAARAGVRPSVEQPQLYEDVNVRGTIDLLEASRRNGVAHFVFGSSSSVYGLNDNVPFREDDLDLRPTSPYAASKLAGEVYCATYNRLYGLPVTSLRFFTVYGPRQRPDMAIHKFVRAIDRGEPIRMFGDGTARRDYTYVDDVVDGIVRATDHPDGCQVFNLGTTETITLRALVATIEGALGKRANLVHEPPQPGDVPITHASIARAQRQLGYRPKVTIAEGIRRFVEWYRTDAPEAAAGPAGAKEPATAS